MAMPNRKIAPLALWLCFLALSFFTTFVGQSQPARMSERDRQTPANALHLEAPRDAKKTCAADIGPSPSPATLRGQ